jgi:O-antigen/teichoic acid export membrane protein
MECLVKNPMHWLIVFVVVVLLIAGISFLISALVMYNAQFRPDVLTPALIAGIICLILATGLLVFGVVVSMFQKRDSVKEQDTSFTARDRL